MEKIEFTKEQIEKIAEGISVICFRSNSEAKKFLLMEYPKVKDVFGNSCIWDDPIYNKEHPQEVKSVLPSLRQCILSAHRLYSNQLLLRLSRLALSTFLGTLTLSLSIIMVLQRMLPSIRVS